MSHNIVSAVKGFHCISINMLSRITRYDSSSHSREAYLELVQNIRATIPGEIDSLGYEAEFIKVQ